MRSNSLTGSHKFISKYLIGGGIAHHTPSTSSCKSHKLMLHSQLIAPSATGTHNLLPLGMRAVDKLCNVIDEEMTKIGCIKVDMTCLSGASQWKKSGRWDSFGDELMTLKVSGSQHCLSPTHEEAITSMVASMGSIPLNCLPLKLYQISTKFRDEPRPRFGLLRGREFLMKDLYTFDKDIESAKLSYQETCEAYENVFRRLNLNFVKAMSSCGNIGGEMSHEYLIPAPVGEDKVIIAEDGTAWNAEFKNDVDSVLKFTESSAIELGHTFLLGTLYSERFNAVFVPEVGLSSPLVMGCYGLGVSRILAACVESLSTDEKIRWPHEIAPFRVCIIPPKDGSKEHIAAGDIVSRLCCDLNSVDKLRGDVIIDDRTTRTIGKRVKDCELLGFPILVILGKGLLKPTPVVEVVFQNRNETVNLPYSDIVTVIEKEF